MKFLIFLFSYLSMLSLHAQHDSIYVVHRIDYINFDGIVDDEAWDKILPVQLIQYSPNPGQAPTEKTEIRFAFDDKYFYGSIRAYDSQPDKIRANSLYRDRLSGSDHFEILLDSYNDNESAFIFNVIPTGVRSDNAISNDATGGTISSGSWINRDFNTFWDTKVSRNAQGWFAEVRIPFSSLRFQDHDGEVIMGLSAQRKIARKLERLVYPAISPTIDWAFLKPSLAQKIMFKGIKPSKTVYITPYVLSGLNQTNEINASVTDYDKVNDFQFDAGADIKFSITNNITMDLSINTDFAQAEADDQLVNLSRFSLFYPEKRQFFQERANIFDFFTGGQSRLFFSRRIGISNDGRAVPIIGGVRAVGRIGEWDLGIMNMQSKGLADFDAENFGVLRVKKRVFNENSYVGGMFTSRLSENGKHNLAFGIDGLIKIFGDDYLNFNWSHSSDRPESIRPNVRSSNDNRFAIELNRRRKVGLGYNIGFIYSGEDYLPAMGFVDRENFKFGTASLAQTWLFPKESYFFSQTIQIKGSGYFDNNSNDLISAEIGAEWQFSNRTLDIGLLSYKWNYENLFDNLSLSKNVSIPIGVYKFSRILASYAMAGEKVLRTGIEIETGTFYDGWLNIISLSPSWYVSKHLELGLQYSFYNATFSERNTELDIHVARLRIGTALNIKLSANTFLQYNSDAKVFSANMRFRYNFKEGNDLWVVLNEGLNTHRSGSIPQLPLSNAKSILIKYLYTFQL